MRRMVIFALVALLALSLASAAVADDCGGYRCPPPEITTPEPTVVHVPWAPVSPLLLLPAISK